MTRPTFTWPIRVYYEDTDATGVVYHARYLHYFERARTEWLRALGFSQFSMNDRLSVVFTVARLEIDFVRPARLDDDLEVTVVVEQLRRASLRFAQALHHCNQPDRVLATARVKVGCVDAQSFRPCALPDEFINGVPA
jgi:acyl-CoA thioester hydrolase